MHPIELISKMYPQVCFPIDQQTKDTPLYKTVVLRGANCAPRIHGFSFSAEDTFSQAATSEGTVDILFLAERSDFERCVQALAYRCEPKRIPPSMGAITISGLINWEKINRHKIRYLQNGGTDWSAEFKRFTACPENYRDILIVVSNGFYSAVKPERIGLTEEEWLKKSLTIRTYHELTHFVFRKRYPHCIDAIRDEVIADAAGLMMAFGRYDQSIAKQLLGIEKDGYRSGGRLENYVNSETAFEPALQEAKELIELLSSGLPNESGQDFDRCVNALIDQLNMTKHAVCDMSSVLPIIRTDDPV